MEALYKSVEVVLVFFFFFNERCLHSHFTLVELLHTPELLHRDYNLYTRVTQVSVLVKIIQLRFVHLYIFYLKKIKNNQVVSG